MPVRDCNGYLRGNARELLQMLYNKCLLRPLYSGGDADSSVQKLCQGCSPPVALFKVSGAMLINRCS